MSAIIIAKDHEVITYTVNGRKYNIEEAAIARWVLFNMWERSNLKQLQWKKGWAGKKMKKGPLRPFYEFPVLSYGPPTGITRN